MLLNYGNYNNLSSVILFEFMFMMLYNCILIVRKVVDVFCIVNMERIDVVKYGDGDDLK